MTVMTKMSVSIGFCTVLFISFTILTTLLERPHKQIIIAFPVRSPVLVEERMGLVGYFPTAASAISLLQCFDTLLGDRKGIQPIKACVNCHIGNIWR